MGIVKTISNVWSNLTADPEIVQKRWDDTLIAIRNGNYETMESESDGKLRSPYDNSTVRRCLDLMSSNIAQVPILIYQNDSRVPPNFDFYEVLRKPNSYTSSYELKEQTIIYYKLYGEAFWFLNTNDYGYIREIYTLHPKFMKHVQDKPTSPINGWIYNESVPMSVDQVIHFKTFNPYGGVRGLSLLDTILIDLQADKEAMVYNKNFFKNGTKVNGMITLDKDMSTTMEEMRRVLGEFKKEHQGSKNAYKVGILSPGMAYDEFGQTMKDMEYISGRDSIRDRVLVVLGVHKSIVGITDKIDRSTADVALRSLWQTTLKPDCVRIQEKLNAELFDIFMPGYSCSFDFSQVEELKKDMKATTEVAMSLMEIGYTRNEVNTRLSLGMPIDEEGDDRWISAKLKPSELALNPPEPPAPVVAPDEKPPKDDKSLGNLFIKKLGCYLHIQRCDVIKRIVRKKTEFDVEEVKIQLNQLFEREESRFDKMFSPLSVKNNVNKLMYGEKGLNKSISKVIMNEIDEGVGLGETVDQIADRIKEVYKFLEKQFKIEPPLPLEDTNVLY